MFNPDYADLADYVHRSPEHVGYTELFSGSLSLPKPPSFIFGAVPEGINEMLYAPCHVGRVGLWTVRNPIVMRDNIVMQDRCVLTGASTNFPAEHCRHVLGGLGFDPHAAARFVQGRVISLAGPGWNTWGHWLADFLPRLYLFRLQGWDIGRLRWLVPKQLPAYAGDFLRALGVPDTSLVRFDYATESLALSEVVLAENFSAGAVMHPLFPEAVEWIRGGLRQWTVSSAARLKVFLSRRSTPTWRALSNRVELEAMARRFDYHVVDPSTLTAQAQVALLATASHVAGEYGSALHSSIFADRGAVITCFRSTALSPGFLQSGIAASMGQRIGYVFGDTIPGDPNQAFTLDMRHVEAGFALADSVGR